MSSSTGGGYVVCRSPEHEDVLVIKREREANKNDEIVYRDGRKGCRQFVLRYQPNNRIHRTKD